MILRLSKYCLPIYICANKDALPGGKKISKFTYKSEEFKERSQKEIIEMLIDQFGATRPRHTRNKKQLVFDLDKLKQMRDKYNLNVDVKVVPQSKSKSKSKSDSYRTFDESDESDVGLDRHLSTGTDSEKVQDNSTEDTNNFNNPDKKPEENTTDQSNIDPLSSNKAGKGTGHRGFCIHHISVYTVSLTSPVSVWSI